MYLLVVSHQKVVVHALPLSVSFSFLFPFFTLAHVQLPFDVMIFFGCRVENLEKEILFCGNWVQKSKYSFFFLCLDDKQQGYLFFVLSYSCWCTLVQIPFLDKILCLITQWFAIWWEFLGSNFFVRCCLLWKLHHPQSRKRFVCKIPDVVMHSILAFFSHNVILHVIFSLKLPIIVFVIFFFFFQKVIANLIFCTGRGACGEECNQTGKRSSAWEDSESSSELLQRTTPLPTSCEDISVPKQSMQSDPTTKARKTHFFLFSLMIGWHLSFFRFVLLSEKFYWSKNMLTVWEEKDWWRRKTFFWL